MDQNKVNLTQHDLPQILDYISESIIIYDSTPRAIFVNKATCEMLRIHPSDWLGKTPDEHLAAGIVDRSILKIAIETKKDAVGILHSWTGQEFLGKSRCFFNADGTIKFSVVTTICLTDVDNLKIKLEKERHQTEKYRQENEYLRKYVSVANEHIFANQGMQNMVDFIKKVAPLDCTILITGESGVGKEVLAKSLHENSQRSHMPFIPVSIPAIPENLLEAELFGYDQGAFTGSRRGGKLGYFEMAQGGTLFLDEVGDIPLNVQVKILRALESHEIYRLGGTKNIKLDVRIISATNKNIHDEIARGRFREDLFYRLNVVPFLIKPLRERPQAIIPLSLNFLNEINNKYRVNKEFSNSALKELIKYHWPGNIRELKNIIERLSIFSDDDIISDSNVKDVLSNSEVRNPAPAHFSNLPKESNGTVLSKYEDYEQNRLLQALQESRGNKTKAANMLGISRPKLYRILNKELA